MLELSKDGRLSKITTETLVPMSLIGSLIGLTFWVSGIYYTGAAVALEVKEMKAEQRFAYEAIVSLDKRLSVLEAIARKDTRGR